MAQASWAPVLANLLKDEGRFNITKGDRGGPTNFGVTQGVYDNYAQRNGLPKTSVQNIAPAHVYDIYKNNYWDQVRADELPVGLDYLAYDFGVNSGPGTAAQFINRALGLSGTSISDETISRAAKSNIPEIVGQVTSARREMVQNSSKIAEHLKPGIINRVNAVNLRASKAAQSGELESEAPLPDAFKEFFKPPRPYQAQEDAYGQYPTTPVSADGASNEPGSATLGALSGVQPLDYSQDLIDPRFGSQAQSTAPGGFGLPPGSEDFGRGFNTSGFPVGDGSFAGGLDLRPGPQDFASGLNAGSLVDPTRLGSEIQPRDYAQALLDPRLGAQASSEGTAAFGLPQGYTPQGPLPDITDPLAGSQSQTAAAQGFGLPSGFQPYGPPPVTGEDFGPSSYGPGTPPESQPVLDPRVASQAATADAGKFVLPEGFSLTDPRQDIGPRDFGQNSATQATDSSVFGLPPGFAPTPELAALLDPLAGSQAGTTAPGNLGAGIVPSAPAQDVGARDFASASQAQQSGTGNLGSFVLPNATPGTTTGGPVDWSKFSQVGSQDFGTGFDAGSFGTPTSFGEGIQALDYSSPVTAQSFAAASQAGTTAPGSLGAGITPLPIAPPAGQPAPVQQAAAQPEPSSPPPQRSIFDSLPLLEAQPAAYSNPVAAHDFAGPSSPGNFFGQGSGFGQGIDFSAPAMADIPGFGSASRTMPFGFPGGFGDGIDTSAPDSSPTTPMSFASQGFNTGSFGSNPGFGSGIDTTPLFGNEPSLFSQSPIGPPSSFEPNVSSLSFASPNFNTGSFGSNKADFGFGLDTAPQSNVSTSFVSPSASPVTEPSPSYEPPVAAPTGTNYSTTFSNPSGNYEIPGMASATPSGNEAVFNRWSGSYVDTNRITNGMVSNSIAQTGNLINSASAMNNNLLQGSLNLASANQMMFVNSPGFAPGQYVGNFSGSYF